MFNFCVTETCTWFWNLLFGRSFLFKIAVPNNLSATWFCLRFWAPHIALQYTGVTLFVFVYVLIGRTLLLISFGFEATIWSAILHRFALRIYLHLQQHSSCPNSELAHSAQLLFLFVFKFKLHCFICHDKCRWFCPGRHTRRYEEHPLECLKWKQRYLIRVRD